MLPTQQTQQAGSGPITPQQNSGGAAPEPSFNITNKKTGETRNVTVSQAQKMGFDDKFINDKLTASSNLRNTIATPNPLSKADQTRHDALQTALTSLDNTQKNFVTGGGAEGPLAGSVALGFLHGLDLTGVANQNSRIETATNIAKAITGSSRAPSDITNKFLESLPAVNDTKEQAQMKLDKLYGQLTSQAQSFKFNDLVDQYGNQNNSGNTPNTNTPNNPQQQTNNQQSQQPAGNEPPTLLNQAPKFLASILGLDKLKQFGNVVNNIPQTLQEGAKEIQQNGALSAPQPALLKLLGQDPNANPVQRAYDSSGMVQGAAGAIAQPLMAASGIQKLLAGGVGNAASAIGGLFKGGDKTVLKEGLNLIKDGGAARDAAISAAEQAGKTIDGSALTKGIQDWGQKAITSGQDAAGVNKTVSQITQNLQGKALTPGDAKALWDTASQGFKDSGKAGDTVLSGAQRALRDSLRTELEKVAPGFEKATSQMAEGFGKSKLLKQVSDSIEKQSIKSNLKSPLQKLLSNGVVKTGVTLGGGAELLNLMRGGK